MKQSTLRKLMGKIEEPGDVYEEFIVEFRIADYDQFLTDIVAVLYKIGIN